MALKDYIKKYNFWYLVDSLAERRVRAEGSLEDSGCTTEEMVSFYKETYEDALLEILTTQESEKNALIQSVETKRGFLNFYIEDKPNVKNLPIVCVDWADIISARIRVVPLKQLGQPQEMEALFSILLDMTTIGFSQEEINDIKNFNSNAATT